MKDTPAEYDDDNDIAPRKKSKTLTEVLFIGDWYALALCKGVFWGAFMGGLLCGVSGVIGNTLVSTDSEDFSVSYSALKIWEMDSYAGVILGVIFGTVVALNLTYRAKKQIDSDEKNGFLHALLIDNGFLPAFLIMGLSLACCVFPLFTGIEFGNMTKDEYCNIGMGETLGLSILILPIILVGYMASESQKITDILSNLPSLFNRTEKNPKKENTQSKLCATEEGVPLDGSINLST